MILEFVENKELICTVPIRDVDVIHVIFMKFKNYVFVSVVVPSQLKILFCSIKSVKTLFYEVFCKITGILLVGFSESNIVGYRGLLD